MAQRDDIVRTVSGRGQYRLTQEYAHLLVSSQKWISMTSEQCKSAISRFDSAKVKCAGVSAPLLSIDPPPATSTTKELPRQLSITAEESGISTLPFATLSSIWSKAEEYLNSSNLVLPAPGGTCVIASQKWSLLAVALHLTLFKQCHQANTHVTKAVFSGAHLISVHTLVAADMNKELELFLQWYTSSGQESNITKLAQAGLPSGRGRKGGVSKRK